MLWVVAQALLCVCYFVHGC